ncbi:MAG TPA: hypothetical protein VD931_15110 [Baekduia sp.]|nr:hypothetical protein [Baekduia sp.]
MNEEPEIVDGEVVEARRLPAGAPPRERLPLPIGSVAVQAAAVAATGFVAGAATLALARHARVRRAAKVAPRRGQTAKGGVPVLLTRSFLVDVHLLAGRPE